MCALENTSAQIGGVATWLAAPCPTDYVRPVQKTLRTEAGGKLRVESHGENGSPAVVPKVSVNEANEATAAYGLRPDRWYGHAR